MSQQLAAAHDAFSWFDFCHRKFSTRRLISVKVCAYVGDIGKTSMLAGNEAADELGDMSGPW
jgi:hypothetical protein